MELFKIFGTIGAKNDEALSKIRETTKEAEGASGKITGTFAKVQSGVTKGLKAAAGFGAVATAGVAAIFGLSNATAEFTEDMGKLETAFTQAGKSSQQAQATYKGFVGLLGETDTAVEASNHLAQLCSNEQELSEWTNIAAGVYAEFGDSLPLEGLTEAANETAKVGQITGPMADAINWASVTTQQWSAALAGHSGAQAAFNAALKQGMSAEDAYNEALKACNSEQERSQMVTQTLSAIYGEAGEAYREMNADLIASREAQSDFNAQMAEAGEAVRPIQTALLEIATALLEKAMPYIKQFGDWFSENLPLIQEKVSEVMGKVGEAIQAVQPIIQPVLDLIMSVFQWLVQNLPTIAPIIVAVVTAFMGLSGIISVLSGVFNALNMLRNGITLVTTAFNLLKVAFMANPFGLIVTAITVLVGVFITLWNTNESFRTAVINIWNAISSTAMSIFNGIASFLSGLWNGIKSVVSSVWNGISSFLSGLWNGISSTASGVWNGIKNAISSVVNGIKNTVSNVFNSVKNTVSNVWNGIKNGISNAINTARDAVKGAIDKIKGFFNFKVSLPTIKLPHFSIKPSGWQLGDLMKGSIPSLGISWRAKGGVFDKPTIFATPRGLQGVGEAGAEAVAPIDVLRTYIREEMAAVQGNTAAQLAQIYSLLAELLPQAVNNSGNAIVLDTGVLVGEIAPAMDIKLGGIARKRARGQ